MESLQIPREVAAFLTQPHLGVLATVSSLGNPQTTVVWYEFRDSTFWFYVGSVLTKPATFAAVRGSL